MGKLTAQQEETTYSFIGGNEEGDIFLQMNMMR
jgi:hypothetical protein